MNELMSKWMLYGWMNEWSDKLMNGAMNEWMNECDELLMINCGMNVFLICVFVFQGHAICICRDVWLINLINLNPDMNK